LKSADLIIHCSVPFDFDTMEKVLVATSTLHPQLAKERRFVTGHISALREPARSRNIHHLCEPSSRLLSHWLFWRQHTDEDGALGRLGRVRQSRMPLVVSWPSHSWFTTDNIALRMLLWPHPCFRRLHHRSIHAGRLVRTAMAPTSLTVDVVENGSIANRLQRCLTALPMIAITRPT
jgi:hypothetical protein